MGEDIRKQRRRKRLTQTPYEPSSSWINQVRQFHRSVERINRTRRMRHQCHVLYLQLLQHSRNNLQPRLYSVLQRDSSAASKSWSVVLKSSATINVQKVSRSSYIILQYLFFRQWTMEKGKKEPYRSIITTLTPSRLAVSSNPKTKYLAAPMGWQKSTTGSSAFSKFVVVA